jgi:hypothetical protein
MYLCHKPLKINHMSLQAFMFTADDAYEQQLNDYLDMSYDEQINRLYDEYGDDAIIILMSDDELEAIELDTYERITH